MTDQNFELMRQAMVASQLRTNGVNDVRVLEAMKAVKRESFVPVDRKALAYVDVAVPLDHGRALTAPMSIGRLLTEVSIGSGDNVLVVGAGLGYTAAIIGRLSKMVVAVEEDGAMATRATAALQSEKNVTVIEAALNEGWADSGPYDVIFIDGSVEAVPDSVADQLKEGGRIAAGLIEDGVTRLAIGRKAGGLVGFSPFVDAEIPPLPGFAKPKAFKF